MHDVHGEQSVVLFHRRSYVFMSAIFFYSCGIPAIPVVVAKGTKNRKVRNTAYEMLISLAPWLMR